MPSRFYKILEKGFYIFFYIILAGLFLRGEVFRIHTKWFSITFTSVKNFVLVFILWRLAIRIKTKPRISLWLLPILILGIVSILLSEYPIISIGAGCVLLIYVLWFYSIRDILRIERGVVNTVVLMVSLAGLINIADLYFHYSVGLGEILEKYPFWEGKNALGLFLVMALCLTGSFPGKLWAINSLLLILGIIFSYSRGAWLSGLVVVAGLAAYRFRRAVFVIIGCIVILLIISPRLVSERFSSIFTREDINIRQRLDLWDNTIEIVKERPIIGTGLGTFTEAYRDKYPDLVPLRGEGARTIRHAHSLYLQILAETGILGLVIFISMVFVGFVYSVRNFIKERNKFIKSIRYGSLLGITAFLIYSITDCTTSWQFIGDSFSHINLIWILLWAISLRPSYNEN